LIVIVFNCHCFDLSAFARSGRPFDPDGSSLDGQERVWRRGRDQGVGEGDGVARKNR